MHLPLKKGTFVIFKHFGSSKFEIFLFKKLIYSPIIHPWGCFCKQRRANCHIHDLLANMQWKGTVIYRGENSAVFPCNFWLGRFSVDKYCNFWLGRFSVDKYCNFGLGRFSVDKYCNFDGVLQFRQSR